MASLKVLREWCRGSCAGYPNVEVRDWTGSFRSGLAFCAIIHKHKPDLIDFSSLSKDNAYQNNRLAFEVAETKLGIAALLDVKEMVSTREPDDLAVITYLFQFYYLFNRTSIANFPSFKSSHAAILNNPATSTHAQNPKSLTHLESAGGDTKPRVPCQLCFKPVHLIQRRLVDGRIYHRTCFRSKHCHLCLSPGSYTKGSNADSLTCRHHVTGHRDRSNDQDESHGYLSLSGLAVSSVPHYPMKTGPPAQDELVSETPQIQNKERETDSPCGTYSEFQKTSLQESKEGSLEKNGCNKQEVRNTGETLLAGVPEEEGRPVPAQGRMVTSYGVPVPTVRTKTNQRMSSSVTQGSSDKTNDSSPVTIHRGTSPTSGSSRVKTSHPWLKIIHPGPWTQLPPAPAPIPSLRSKSVTQPTGVWYQPKKSAPNPFQKEKDPPLQKQTDNVGETEQKTDAKDDTADSEEESEVGEAASRGNDEDTSQVGLTCATESVSEVSTDAVATDEATSHSEEAIVAPSVANLPETNVRPSSTTVHSENPTLPEPLGHGFPLIKRKVQTDQCVSTEYLQQQMEQVAKHLKALEEQGVELERDIRVCSNNKDAENLLMDWFSLVHERHILIRRDTELVYLIKQQTLEQRQEDVEYELRCLLNKPDGEWCDKDRRQESQLMEELVKIIEQRNQIISSLDEDVQREREKDMGWDAMMKNKDFQKRELKELKKSKGKFKTTSVFKMLNQKDSTRGSTDKKN